MKTKILLILIIFLSIFFRFYRFPELFHWTMDEDYWSYLPFNIATGYHFPAIGGHIAGTGLYSGPLFIYLMAIPAKIFGGDPLGFGVVVATIGVLTTWLVFFIANKIFSGKVGIIASFLYASSFLMAIFDRHYWNASLTPFLSALTMWFIWEIWNKRFKFVLPLALTLALAFHAHGTGMALIIFTIVSWLVFRLPIRNRWVVFGIGIFMFLQMPLIFFELRHGFTNERALAKYFVTNDKGTVSMGERLTNITSGFFNAGARLIYFPAKDLAFEQTLGLTDEFAARRGESPPLARLVIIGLVVFTLFKLRLENTLKLPVILIISTLAGLLIYKGKIPEYFFSPTFVPVFFLLGFLLEKLLKYLRWNLTLIILLMFLLFNLNNLFTVRHSFGYSTRLETVQKVIAKAGDKPFSLDAQCRNFCQLYGFRYLFTYLRHEPVVSYLDANFLWLYEKRLLNEKPEKAVRLEMNNQKIQIYVSDFR